VSIYYQLGYDLFKFFGSVLFSFRLVHPERMIEEGPALLAMNHQSFIDPPMAGISCTRELHTLARDTLFKPPLMRWILPKINVIPLDRSGGDMSAVKLSIRLIKEGKAMLMFPEGTRTKDGNLQPAQPGIGFIIAKTLVPVVPMRIFGAYESLPRSGKKFRPGPVTIVIGEPIYFTKADLDGGRDVYQRLSDRVMAAIAAIELPDGAGV